MNGLLDWLNHAGGSSSQRKDRRAKKAKSPINARRTKYEPQSPPPVMVRGSAAGLPLQKRRPTKSKVRRRFDLSLSVPGAEMRLPAIPQVTFGMRLISGVMVVGLVFMLYFLWNSPTFRVNVAQITGLQRLSGQDVNTVLNITGKPIFQLNTAQLEDQLTQAFPEFSSVSVQIGFPNEVSVSVDERTPILTWKQDGRTVLVDPNGFAFPQRELTGGAPSLVIEASGPPPALQPAVPEAAGSENIDQQAQFIPVEMVSAILSMSAVAPANSTLIYNKDHGLGWKDAQGWEAYLGDVHDIDMKLKVYQALVKQLKKDRLKPVLISVEYVHNPYYRLEH
jgi:cell division septal protein FtsQ